MSDVVSTALTYLGVPYVWGGNGYEGIDCSGLTQQSYKANGINIPRVAQDQYNASTKIEASDLQPGDLIFESNTKSQNNITHVLMYIGEGKAIEAPRSGLNVRITDVNSRSNIVGYGTYNANAQAVDTDNINVSGGNVTNTGKDSSGGWIDSLLSNITKFIFITLIGVIGVIFMMQAFN